jgi:hypothetical protein
MAFYGTDRHTQHSANLGRIEIFLISQQHDHPGIVRQVRHEAPQTLIQQRVRIIATDRGLRYRFKADLRAQFPLSRFVNASMADGPPKPPGGMRRTFNVIQFPIQLQENILRKLLRPFFVAQEAHGEAENQRLIVRHDLREIQCHIRYYG